MPDNLNIVICTYNRAEELRRMLRSLADSIGESSHEARVLVVDNGGTDHTQSVIREFASRLSIRSVTESRQGLSAARNRAIAEVGSGAIWFLDDDVIVEPGCFQAACRALADHPDADWIGGRVLPRWSDVPPAWMSVEPDCPYKGMLVWYDEGPDATPLTLSMPPFFGANIMFRRRVFDAGHRFDEDLGRIGTRARLGEEAHLQTALQREGRTGWYVPAATVYHPVPPERLRLRYLATWHRESGRASVLMARRSGLGHKWFGVPRYMFRQVMTDLVQGGWDGVRGILSGSSARCARGLAAFSLGLGKAGAIWGACLRYTENRHAEGPWVLSAGPARGAHEEG